MRVSFRDPSGSVIVLSERVIRLLTDDGAADLNAFIGSPVHHSFAEAGLITGTRILTGLELREALSAHGPQVATKVTAAAEHERIWFPSYPYEWPPRMLHAAGRLTLRFAEDLLGSGLGLKDATPHNLLFRGPKPVFVDLSSIERRDPRDPTWLPYAQFARTFLLPLLVNKYFGLPLGQILEFARDGLEPETVYRMCGPIRRLTLPFLPLVTLPTWLGSRRSVRGPSTYRQRRSRTPDEARYILARIFRHLGRTLERLTPSPAKSSWFNYMSPERQESEAFGAKRDFVLQALGEICPKTVLDVGCNTGYMSSLAAGVGARVVAIDQDAAVIEEVWRTATQKSLDILPLVVDITSPSPSTGWRNAERLSFLERAFGAFDAVLMLAVIHHMIVSERIPLNEIVKLAAELTRKALVIEFVEPSDPLFRDLTRGRDGLFEGLTVSAFEDAVQNDFDVVRRRQLPGSSRWLYHLNRRQVQS